MDGLLGNQLGGYKVQIPVYEGPLDLLLSLIERAELDITAISLASVTDQYLAHLQGLERLIPDEISSFLVIAAKLVQIKSEALLPRPPEREAGEEDPGIALVEQLKLYKRFKEIGVWLEERQAKNLRTFLRVAPPPKVVPKLDLSEPDARRLAQRGGDGVCQREGKEAADHDHHRAEGDHPRED
ncbi:MAG: segregation/condensation protein A [Chloroflexi bacterium]|nr:segregation/condensation protein A [Chloroflexota bacterium]